MGYEGNCFDPLKKIQTAESAMPEELSKLNFRTLTPFQRALMVADGTVTKFIEAYTLDPVEIIRLNQKLYPLDEDHPWLEAERGTNVMFREVIIRGVYSHTLYVHGVSYIVPDRLPPDMRQRLEVQGEGIGRLLNEAMMETRREVLWFGREKLPDPPSEIASVSNGEFITRAYRIIEGGKPIVMINERFPVMDDVLPQHH
jgi:chorismate-pyruvate lyase